MNYLDNMQEEKKEFKERYDLAIERIQTMLEEKDSLLNEKAYQEYFIEVATFIINMEKTRTILESGKFEQFSLDEMKKLNQENYYYILESVYEKSYLNPAYAVSMLGEEFGVLFSFLFTEMQGMIASVYEHKYFEMTILAELFIEVYNYMKEDPETAYQKVKNSIYYHFRDYLDITIKRGIRESLDPDFTFVTDLILNADLSDVRYLYKFGELVTENEIRTALFLNQLTEDEVEKMATTYTEGYRLGFENANIDLSKKSTVNIRYCLGFERMVKAAIKQFKQMGLNVTFCRASVSRVHKRQHFKNGYYSPSYNKQYEYDHRFDDSLYLDKAFIERRLVCLKKAYEDYKDLAKKYAGPAVIQIFGERPFEPVNKKEVLRLNEKQQKLLLQYQRESNVIVNQYIKSNESSFTIIAYPIPDIGNYFEAIFYETVKVNTLDINLYRKIQQSMIDVLDQGEYVYVKGSGRNKTDLKVMLHTLQNPEKETNFENCLADVNIPVGEVFTSPKLKDTEGVLHVSEVYLRDLKYYDLEISFKDGMITSYNCKNFDSEEENKAFIKENLLYHHETLPIGEFAIGTNTTAYRMGQKYKIQDKLPILIAEKTGPHFAVGDTCYKMSEENQVYNPDGKEVVAKDNECSVLRKTDMEKAYFNCHTDITIPYDELGEISVYYKDGQKVMILENGKFVLLGTEELNKALVAE